MMMGGMTQACHECADGPKPAKPHLTVVKTTQEIKEEKPEKDTEKDTKTEQKKQKRKVGKVMEGLE